MTNSVSMHSPMSPGKFWSLRRMANESGHFTMLAVDQRPPIKALCTAGRGEDTARFEDIRAVKQQLMKSLSPHASAVLADPTYALSDALRILMPHHGLIVTLEDSLFADNDDGRVSNSINNWSVEKIKRVGGNAVKVLIWYRPDQSEKSKQQQHDYARAIGAACQQHDIPFLLELLVYPMKDASNHTTDYVEQTDKRAEHVIQSVEDFAAPDFGVDIFKLESPLPAPSVPDPTSGSAEVSSCQAYFNELGKVANRPWVMLSAGATKSDFRNVLHYAYEAGASGYLAGRAIWWEDAQCFPDIQKMSDDMETNAVPYVHELQALTAERATPWHKHAIFGGDAQSAGSSESDFASWYAQ